jgi:hypothetical protein
MEKEYIELKQQGQVREVGRCKNRYEEEFVIYQMGAEATYYVTGSEFNWELGIKIVLIRYPMLEGYNLSEEERVKIQGVIDKHKGWQ